MSYDELGHSTGLGDRHRRGVVRVVVRGLFRIPAFHGAVIGTQRMARCTRRMSSARRQCVGALDVAQCANQISVSVVPRWGQGHGPRVKDSDEKAGPEFN